METPEVQRFLANKCRNLSPDEKKIVGETLRRIRGKLNLRNLRTILPVYVGMAIRSPKREWLLLVDWNVLNKPFAAKSGRRRETAKRAAVGALALNLAHYAMRHTISKIHTPRAYREAATLVKRWGLGEELAEMERAYL